MVTSSAGLDGQPALTSQLRMITAFEGVQRCGLSPYARRQPLNLIDKLPAGLY
jgi:hypothetical protein